jgi:hypothetical protein
VANNISVSIVADVKDMRSKLSSVEKQLSGFGKTVGKLGTAMKGAFALAAGSAVIGQLGSMVTAASDLNETMSKSQTVFGTASKDIEAFANSAAKNLGLSKQEALAGMAQFGNLFDQLKIGKPAAANMAKGFAQMSADLASFNNLEPAQVMEAFTSATRGEFDALQAVIPTINAAAIETEALRQTHKKSAKDLTEADKVNALYSLSVKGMGKAQGDFQRTSKGLANQQRILSAEWKNAQATIGQALLPALTKLINWVNSEGLPKVKALGDYFKTVLWPVLKDIGTNVASVVVPAFQTLGKFFADHTTLVKGLVVALASLAAGFVAYKTVLTTITLAQNAYAIASNVVKAATTAWTAVQWLLNAALTANPIGIVIVAIGLLVAAIVILWNKNEGFRKALIAAWNAIKTAAVTVWNAIKTAVSTAFNAVSKVVSSVGTAIKNAVVNTWNTIKKVIGSAIGAVKSAVSTGFSTVRTTIVNAWKAVVTGVAAYIKGLVNLAAGIKNRILSALAGAGTWLYQIGKNIIQGLINGIGAMAGSVISKAKGLANSVKDTIAGALKIGSPSRLMFQMGRWTSEGLALGIEDRFRLVRNAAKGLSGAVTGGFASTNLNGGLATSGVAGGPAINITLNVTAPVGSNGALIGKEIVGHLQEFVDTYGKRQTRNLV